MDFFKIFEFFFGEKSLPFFSVTKLNPIALLDRRARINTFIKYLDTLIQ